LSKEKWIQGSIEHAGRVHRYVIREYGDKALSCHGNGHCTIKEKYIDRAIERARAMNELSLERALVEARTLKRLARRRTRDRS
jgi:hypothetical protein